jgi:hypothetical protein
VDEIADPLSRAHALVQLARGYGQVGRVNEARQLLSQAHTLTDQVDSTLQAELKQEIQRARAELL